MDNNNFVEESHIYEPVKAYKFMLKDQFNTNATAYFDDLVQQSNVNIEENRSTVKQINKLDKEISHTSKSISVKIFWKVLLILLIIISIGALAYSVYSLTKGAELLVHLLVILSAIIITTISIIVLIKKINPSIKNLTKIKEDLQTKRKEHLADAWNQMAPLNKLFKEGMNIELFKKTIPIINIDRNFNSKRLDYMMRKFNLDELVPKDHSRSALYIKSGDINGNPFFIANDLVHHLGTKVYTGQITIHWTSTSRVNGKTVTQHHSQVLTASVEKPCPYYYNEPYLAYGNEAAPDLIFSREDSDAENLNQKQIDKHVNKNIKKLEKAAQKSITKGGNYTVLGNSEFEVLFGATNRNNEVQFRLLFTPLAQKQLLEIMKDKESGFGDNFDFVKHKRMNFIYPDNLKEVNLNPKPSEFYGYDFDNVKERFLDYHNKYFRHVFFAFAPILAIPLYQQHKPFEFIYKDVYDSYVSFFEHECVVNALDINKLKHELSSTPNILKTKVVKSANNCDTVNVIAYGYETQPRTDYVTKFGGDGRSHTIPVHWIEYIPVQQASMVDINVIDEPKEETYQEKIRNFFENLKDNKSISAENVVQVGTFIAVLKRMTKDKK